jgi:ferredoxin
MHCNEPCCAAVCPVHAFSKTPEGPVLYDAEVCMGCRYCITACPYYALAYEYDDPLTPRVMRCTMCYPLIKEGLSPACAAVCPVGAITYGERAQLLEVARERIRKFPDRYLNHVYGEHEFGGTSWLILAWMPFEEMGATARHPRVPAVDRDQLPGVVPLVITIYPGLLAGFYAFSKRRERLANEEREAAVAEALARAREETQQKLAAAADKSKKDQERAVQQAVQRALAEQQKRETGS